MRKNISLDLKVIEKAEEKAISCIQGDEVAKIKGSKCANTAALSGIGVS